MNRTKYLNRDFDWCIQVARNMSLDSEAVIDKNLFDSILKSVRLLDIQNTQVLNIHDTDAINFKLSILKRMFICGLTAVEAAQRKKKSDDLSIP
jgi:hypothetical protein